MHLILFDCDGTLADSFGLICETMRRTFVLNGFDTPAEADVHAVIGLSLDRAIHQLRPETDAAALPALVEAYRAGFRAVRDDPAFREKLFPGIPDLLKRLRGRNELRLGMVTGKTRRGVDAVVATHGLDGVFSAVRTADDCPSKPHPAMVLECCEALGIPADRTIVVGDAVFDMAMARNASATAVGVAWGASAPAALMAAGAGFVATDVAELGTSIEGWIAGRPLSAGAVAELIL